MNSDKAIAIAEPLLPAKVRRQPPVSIDTFLTKSQFVELVKHMANGNPVSHFLVVHHDGEGRAHYAKAKPHRQLETHASWTYDTITGSAKTETSMGLYPKNNDNKSTWGAIDFDAHRAGQDEIAKNRSIRAFTLLLEYRDRYLILSASGRGYHVFILANEPCPVDEWTKVLKDAADSVGATIEDGACEIFPNDKTAQQEVGKAIRVPGSMNPTTGDVELILADTIMPLVKRLERQETPRNIATSARNSLTPKALALAQEANNYFYTHRFFTSSTKRLIDEVIAKYPVKRKGTRNGTLVRMTGELFRKFGFRLSELIVEHHYDLNKGNVTTSKSDHIKDFHNAWRSFRDKEERHLNEDERRCLEKLQTYPQQESFFLCRAFARFKNPFPLSQQSLADRLSMTRQGAGYVIARLVEIEAIKKTADAKPHSKSACYRWVRSNHPGI